MKNLTQQKIFQYLNLVYLSQLFAQQQKTASGIFFCKLTICNQKNKPETLINTRKKHFLSAKPTSGCCVHGIGGLEATISLAANGSSVTHEAAPIKDFLGNVLGHVDGKTSSINWSPTATSAYGPAANTTVKVFGEDTDKWIEAVSWRGYSVDSTGFINMGERKYDYHAGRFISTDPLGHAASADLYNYANCDPINFVDPLGRFAMSTKEISALAPGEYETIVANYNASKALTKISDRELFWSAFKSIPKDVFHNTPKAMLNNPIDALTTTGEALGPLSGMLGGTGKLIKAGTSFINKIASFASQKTKGLWNVLTKTSGGNPYTRANQMSYIYGGHVSTVAYQNAMVYGTSKVIQGAMYIEAGDFMIGLGQGLLRGNAPTPGPMIGFRNGLSPLGVSTLANDFGRGLGVLIHRDINHYGPQVLQQFNQTKNYWVSSFSKYMTPARDPVGKFTKKQ